MPEIYHFSKDLNRVTLPELVAASTRVGLSGCKRIRSGKSSRRVASACEQFEASSVCDVLERSNVSFDWIISMYVAMARGGDCSSHQIKALEWLLGLLKGVAFADGAVRRELGLDDSSSGDGAVDTSSPFVVSGYELSRDTA